MRKTTSCKETQESPGRFFYADWPEKKFFWPIRSRQFKRLWNWFGKSKCPGARLNLTENFHHEHFIDPTNCHWVSEDVILPNCLQFVLQWGKDPIVGMKRVTPSLRVFLISMRSFCLCGFRVAHPIINGLVPSPARFETRLVRPRIEILSKQDNNDTFFI